MKPNFPKTDPTNAFDTTSAALYCGLSGASIRMYRLKGGGPAYLKLGRKVVYLRKDLDAWLQSRRIER